MDENLYAKMKHLPNNGRSIILLNEDIVRDSEIDMHGLKNARFCGYPVIPTRSKLHHGKIIDLTPREYTVTVSIKCVVCESERDTSRYNLRMNIGNDMMEDSAALGNYVREEVYNTMMKNFPCPRCKDKIFRGDSLFTPGEKVSAEWVSGSDPYRVD